MAKTDENSQAQMEELTVTLPAYALDLIGSPYGSPVSALHGPAENSPPVFSATAARDESFPCFRMSAWGERVVIKIVQHHDALSAV